MRPASSIRRIYQPVYSMIPGCPLSLSVGRSDDRMHSRLTEQLDEQGYVILRGLVEPQVVAEARADIGGLVDELAAGLIREGQVQSSFSEEPFETRIYQLYRNCLDRAPQSFRRELHLPGIFGYFFHPGTPRPGGIGAGR